MSDLKAELAAFVAAMPSDHDGSRRNTPWFVDGLVPSLDFNREFCPPGARKNLPEGALAIRADDDFWVVALLPWRFAALSIEDLVAVLWPGYVGQAVYNPDSHVGAMGPDTDEDL